MLITRTSPFTRVTRSLEINVSDEQISRWRAGTLIQNAMPHLEPWEREFIKTGITPEEWEDYLNTDEDS
jgi:hypothetical protein